jgi:hypothetical protein
MASARALDEAQNALVNEGAHGPTRGRGGEANAAGEPENGKAELELPFKARVAKEMVIDHALNEIEAQARHESIFDLFPDEERVGDEWGVVFVVFHDLHPVREILVLGCGECPKEKREQAPAPRCRPKGRRYEGQVASTLSFQEVKGRNEPGRAPGNKKGETVCRQFRPQTSYQTDGICQVLFYDFVNFFTSLQLPLHSESAWG